MSPRTKALFAASTIFVLGLGLGCLGTTLVGLHIVRKSLSNPEGLGLVQRALERFRADLVDELKPTPAQLTNIDRELAELGTRVRDTRRRFGQDLLLDLREGSRGVRGCLDEERGARFDSFLEKRLRKYSLNIPADPKQTQASHPDAP